MRKLLVVFAGLLALGAGAWAQDDFGHYSLDGYVTRTVSGTNFDVDGLRVACGESTNTRVANSPRGWLGCPRPRLILGQKLSVVGTLKKKEHVLNTTEIVIHPIHYGEVKGSAIIDAVPEANVPPTARSMQVRADGYSILLTDKTKIYMDPPLRSLADVKPNVWITYKGKQRRDGVVVASFANLVPNIIRPSEGKLLAKTDYNPGQGPPNDGKSALGRAIDGTTYKTIPPFSDPPMQARITNMGEKLIPAYQRNLPDSDLTKINFRFVLVDEPKWHDALSIPSGVILVPRQVVERMQNDSQLAAVLASDIASALEKQTYRMKPNKKEVAADYAFFGLVSGSLVWSAQSAVDNDLAKEQSDRVALDLMNDAGYDVTQAPLAWWLLASEKPRPLAEIELPFRTASLYDVLATTWAGADALAQP